MAMEDTLAGDLACIGSHIEARNEGVFEQQASAHVVEQPHTGHHLQLPHSEDVVHVSPGQDQGVQRRNGVGITNGNGMGVLGDDLAFFDLAEWAFEGAEVHACCPCKRSANSQCQPFACIERPSRVPCRMLLGQ